MSTDWVVPLFIYILVEGSGRNYSAYLQTNYQQLAQVTPVITAHPTLPSVVPVKTSYTNMPPPKAFPSVTSSHWTDCFKELWSYSIPPIWKFFLRTNKFTVKMDLWGFTEGSWKSGRGVPEERDNITQLPVLSVPSLSWKQLLLVKPDISWVQLHCLEK